MQSRKWGILYLCAFSVCVGFTGILVRLTEGLEVTSIVFARAAIGSSFILLVAKVHPVQETLTLRNPLNTILVGLCQGISILLYVTACFHAPIANVYFLLYTAPVFSVILARVFLKESIRKQTLVGAIFAVLGVLFIVDPTTLSLKSGNTLGNFMALGSGFFYAAMAVAAKPLSRTVSAYYIAFWQYVVITVLTAAFVGRNTFADYLVNWWQLASIGILCTGIAFILFMEGVKRVRSQEVFIITALEPVVGTVAAFFVLSEVVSVFTAIGAILIFAGVVQTTRSSPLENS